MNPLVLLAKQAIENYIKEGKIISLPEGLPEEFLTRRAGTFVSIFRSTRKTDAKQEHETDAKELRGCIGTYLPTKENIAEEIIHNAIAAATEDYRFGPVQKEELPYLSYTVYILSEPELVKDIKELDPKKYGIIVKTMPIISPDGTDVVFNGHLPLKSGLLLPDLEGVDTVEKQISIACQKGGIDPLREKILIYKFTVEKYQE